MTLPQKHTPRPRGRPRSERSHRAILQAAFKLIEEQGFAATTIDAIAARASVGKSTIYRRWPSKEELLVDMVQAYGRASASDPDTGDAREDLVLMIRNIASVARRVGPVVASVVGEMPRNEALVRAMRAVGAPRQSLMRKVIQRGIERGELARGIDVDLAVDLTAAVIYFRLLVTRQALPADLAERIADLILEAWGRTDTRPPHERQPG